MNPEIEAKAEVASLESEQALVANAIQSAEIFDTISDIVSSQDFAHEQMRCIWDAVKAMREIPRDVDIATLTAVLNNSSRWQHQQVGDTAGFIMGLLDACSSLRSAVTYAEIVKDRSTTRKLLTYSSSVRELALTPDVGSDEKISGVHTLLEPLSDDQKSGFIGAKDAVQSTVAKINARIDAGGGMPGISTGFDAVDEFTGGLEPGKLYFVGGRPGMGKTVFAMNIANHVAASAHVHVFSLEMTVEELYMRSLAQLSGITTKQIRNGQISHQEMAKFQAAGLQASKLDMLVDDTEGLTVGQVVRRSIVAARKRKPALVVVDYLTLLKRETNNGYQEVAEMAKALKGLAKRLECPVIVLAQLNRGTEGRDDKRPKKSDLREAGEEVADVIMLLYRDEVANKESDRAGILEVIIDKNRGGEEGVPLLKSQLEFQRFVALDYAPPPIRSHKTSSSGLSSFVAANDKEDF